ncbi:hypothetical protein MC378_12665 [Polaribacter sp. MSW13]|uniref:Uncharacterized protein n=1 Tax=Polaribacter marinus TaxID=2916838 RepID=A0A9X2AL00_9FLAO|nr:hypothetical protein [Polaribacter marinus]MCI2230023.1 hypothetical protein [Polaribacter marinus]
MNLTKLLFTSLVFSSLISFGQQSTSEKTKSELLKQNTELTVQIENLKNENEKQKTIVDIKENEILKLKEEIKYYKETLNLFNSKISTKYKDLDFKINSVIGNSNTGKIMVEGIFVNNGVLRSIQGQKAKIFDPKGNGVNSYKVLVGNEKRIDKLYKDIPTKFSVELEQIIEGTPVIKSLMIDFYSRLGYKSDDISIVFKNLTVKWE